MTPPEEAQGAPTESGEMPPERGGGPLPSPCSVEDIEASLKRARSQLIRAQADGWASRQECINKLAQELLALDMTNLCLKLAEIIVDLQAQTSILDRRTFASSVIGGARL